MEAEEERRHAVGEADGDDPERAAPIKREPHQGDVAEGVAELARGDRAEEDPEVAAAQQPEGRRAFRPGQLALARIVEDGIGHWSGLSTLDVHAEPQAASPP